MRKCHSFRINRFHRKRSVSEEPLPEFNINELFNSLTKYSEKIKETDYGFKKITIYTASDDISIDDLHKLKLKCGKVSITRMYHIKVVNKFFT
jgi:hypothetical protein